MSHDTWFHLNRVHDFHQPICKQPDWFAHRQMVLLTCLLVRVRWLHTLFAIATKHNPRRSPSFYILSEESWGCLRHFNRKWSCPQIYPRKTPTFPCSTFREPKTHVLWARFYYHYLLLSMQRLVTLGNLASYYHLVTNVFISIFDWWCIPVFSAVFYAAIPSVSIKTCIILISSFTSKVSYFIRV